MITLPDLPISKVLPELLNKLEDNSNLVLVAPPGAGKTTLVPLVLLDAAWRKDRKIIVLEPRRLAARSAAHRMAELLGENVGERVGYRIRFDTKVSAHTVIEVVTEGVFTRMLSADAGLENIAAILFDEFHERSLDSDLALALCLDLQSGLREDLRLLPMSATLDGARVAQLLDADILESEGRAYPVDVVYKNRHPNERIEQAIVATVHEELAQPDSGSILIFLPGQGEIERTAQALENKLPANVELHKLYGALSPQAQDSAIRKPKDNIRKVVLSSAIAETSLTIEGVTTVIDSGMARQAAFEPATGLTRLQTVRASQASVTQRAGRAGRLGPGRAVRLWHEGQTAALPPHITPEILNADLASLLLDLAGWGVSNVSALKWLDEPPQAAVNEAKKLLTEMDALNEQGMITAHGKAMNKMALSPRYAHMVLQACVHNQKSAERAVLIALLIQERGVGGKNIDLEERCRQALNSRDKRTQNILRLAKQIASNLDGANDNDVLPYGVILAFALPDRIAQRTGTTNDGMVRFRLANGRGAQLEATQQLAQEDFIVVVDMAGRAGAARILSAVALSKSDLNQHFEHLIEDKIDTHFDPATAALTATKSRSIGAVNLTKPIKIKVEGNAANAALLSALKKHGLSLLSWTDSAQKLRTQLALLNLHFGSPWPDVSDDVLLATIDDWLLPFMTGASDFKSLNISDGLMLLAGHPPKPELDRLLPTHFSAPSGSRIAIDYENQKALLRIRPQELFGLDIHPSVLDGKLPMEIELLSPAGRPIQITKDLPGFWRGSWADVRADLRGRYPKHPWPEDPLNEAATARVKLRKR